MAFWSETTLDPKRQFKFSVTFGRLGANSTFLAQSADRPQFKVSDTAKVDFLDKAFYFPGKVTWEPVKIKFVDGGSADTNFSKDAYAFLRAAGWVSPTAVGGTPAGAGAQYGTVGKASSNNALGNVIVRTLNQQGAAVDTWTLKNAFVTSVALNNLDYKAEDILTAEFTFRYDWAELA